MTDFERVIGWFEEGRLVRPSAGRPHFIDLVRSLARHAGAAGIGADEGADRVDSVVGSGGRRLLVLVDALGTSQLERLPRDAFMREHLKERLQSVFLSTTACALSTFATAEWPARHAVPGWWAYLDDRKLDVVTLPFVQRGTGTPLEDLGVPIEALCPLPSVWANVAEGFWHLVPAAYSESVYTTYASGGARRIGYEDLEDAFSRAAEIAVRPDARFTYLYLPHYDAAAHERGTESETVVELLRRIDVMLARLAEDLNGSATMIVTADHGQVNTPASDRIFLAPDDEVLEPLEAVPSGEMTVPFFHVKVGREAEFRERFGSRLGERFALLSVDEVEALELLGPGRLSPVMRRRVGSFIGVAPDPVQLHVVAPGYDGPSFVGVHGGLRPEEMEVPLVVA